MKFLSMIGFLAVSLAASPPRNRYSAPSESSIFNGALNGQLNGEVYSTPSSNGNGHPNGVSPSGTYSAPSSINGNNGFRLYGNGRTSVRANGGFNRNGNGGYGVDPVIEALAENIPGGGVPGEDYPVLSEVAETGFACKEQQFPGYYADTAREAGCQVFHICQDRGQAGSQQDSFLCPNGSIFNQQFFVCDWWFNVDCARSQEFYALNEFIGQENGQNNGYGADGNGFNGLANGNGLSNGFFNGNVNGRNGYRNGASNGNGNGRNGYSNGASNDNGNGRNGYSNGASNGNGNGRNGYSNGASTVNGNGRNGYSNGASTGNGNGRNGSSNRASNSNGNGRSEFDSIISSENGLYGF